MMNLPHIDGIPENEKICIKTCPHHLHFRILFTNTDPIELFRYVTVVSCFKITELAMMGGHIAPATDLRLTET